MKTTVQYTEEKALTSQEVRHSIYFKHRYGCSYEDPGYQIFAYCQNAKNEANLQHEDLIGNLKAIQLLEVKIWELLRVDKLNRCDCAVMTLTVAHEYLKAQTRLMLYQEDWLMDYMLSYACHYFGGAK